MSKALIENYMDGVWNKKQFDLIPKTFSPNAVIHAAIGDFYGSKSMHYIVSAWLNAFPDLHVTWNHTIAENGMVVSHWTSKGTHQGELLQMPASQNKIQYSGTSVFRIIDSQVVEYWAYIDMHNLRIQMQKKA